MVHERDRCQHGEHAGHRLGNLLDVTQHRDVTAILVREALVGRGRGVDGSQTVFGDDPGRQPQEETGPLADVRVPAAGQIERDEGALPRLTLPKTGDESTTVPTTCTVWGVRPVARLHARERHHPRSPRSKPRAASILSPTTISSTSRETATGDRRAQRRGHFLRERVDEVAVDAVSNLTRPGRPLDLGNLFDGRRPSLASASDS